MASGPASSALAVAAASVCRTAAWLESAAQLPVEIKAFVTKASARQAAAHTHTHTLSHTHTRSHTLCRSVSV
jgi:hypothetical protein